jgi:catechol 2,3-dioxygenase-like lactoylglutathione lyase family enzyme
MPNPIPAVSHMLETALYVADLGRSRDFYTGLMGFPVYLEDARMVALGVPGGGVLLLFVHGGSGQGSDTPAGHIPGHDGRGVLHLAFAISPDGLEAWAAHLAAQGVVVESRITWPRGGTSLYFRDPDGHSVEVATPGLWPNYEEGKHVLF